MEEMTLQEYRDNLKTCFLAASFLERMDIPDMLARIERADSFGAVLDPTLYRAKHSAMMEDKALLEAALPLWHHAHKVRAAVEQERARRRGEEETESEQGLNPPRPS